MKHSLKRALLFPPPPALSTIRVCNCIRDGVLFLDFFLYYLATHQSPCSCVIFVPEILNFLSLPGLFLHPLAFFSYKTVTRYREMLFFFAHDTRLPCFSLLHDDAIIIARPPNDQSTTLIIAFVRLIFFFNVLFYFASKLSNSVRIFGCPYFSNTYRRLFSLRISSLLLELCLCFSYIEYAYFQTSLTPRIVKEEN